MKTNKRTAAALFGATAIAISGLAVAPATAGTNDLVSVITSDGGKRFDKKGGDYDVLAEAVGAVLAAKPDSPVAVLADGTQKLTAFAPTDNAFKKTASALTGTKIKSERKAFKTVAGLGIDTVETVLLYHVVPGTKITAAKAAKANGAKIETAQGGTFKVKVNKRTGQITLKDKDPDLANARVVLHKTNINKGNKQIAHGISRVMLPVNL